MSEPSAFPQLADDDLVYRAATSATWIDRDNNALLPQAFFLREKDGQIEPDISIFYNCTLDHIKAQFDPCHAIAVLRVGDIRKIEHLDVVPDTPTHANLTGLSAKSVDLDQSQYHADLLAEASRLVWTRR